MSTAFRLETDSLGKVKVPYKALWGAQTQRSLKNFDIGSEKIPLKLIYAIAKIKQAASRVNCRLGVLDVNKQKLIEIATSQIINGDHDAQFPLRIWQTGSGTHSNMNVNEVISNIAAKSLNHPLGTYHSLHPNDDVNQSQSTNDVFPGAIQIATIEEITTKLLPEINLLRKSFADKSKEWANIIKVGRTHLQDAVPMTLGQEVSAWEKQIELSYSRIESSLNEIYDLPLGGTAIGTGLNSPNKFSQEIALEIADITKLPFRSTRNKFALMASHDGLVNLMAQLKILSVSLFKISNDIRLLSCGPRTGLGELSLPENEPGSSIMPGKINPTQCEAMSMVCIQIMAFDSAVSIAGSSGHLQMNAYKPLIAFNLLKSIELLYDACKSFRVLMLDGIKPNHKKIKTHLENSLMLVTALTPKIGYKKASEIAQFAHKNNTSLKQAAIHLKYISSDEFDKVIDPSKMIDNN